MTREHVLMFLGFLVLISPWSGLPLSWLEWILVVLGIAIIGISYAWRPRERHVIPPPPPQAPQDEPRPRSSHIAFS